MFNKAWLAATLVVSVLALSGCAKSAKFVRSEPAMHFQAKTAFVVPPGMGELIKLHCIQSESITYADGGTESDARECVYISAEASPMAFAPVTTEQREATIGALLTISDLNCSTFLHRSFAVHTSMDYGKSLTQDIVTAASAGTAAVSAPLSAALGVGNLVVGKTIDNFNSTYYFDKSFQAMEAAIMAERTQRRAYIAARRAETNYSWGEALIDIRSYDDACSIKSGLARLIKVAEAEKAKSEVSMMRVEASATSKVEAYRAEYSAPVAPPSGNRN